MIGTRLAHYEITAHLGSGGMGDVYQATDSKLGRSVAIKFLPAAFASDAERLSRFRREAQLLASLNHPNIAHIYGLEESGETRCIVMELIEGETLQARIQRGPIPVDDALAIAKQIVDALETAHEKAVIHRDLKPGNVMITGDGKVKVLDFGLAKVYETNSSNPTLSNSPTMASMAATNAGVILGTVAYMAPEQARGRVVDKRADIFAFGVVLYEMLTGTRAFEDEDVSMTLSKVLQREPDFDALPPTVPPRVRQALRLCLRKDPKQRVADIRDVRLALEGAFETVVPETATTTSSASRGRLAWIAFAVAAVVIVVMAVPTLRHLRETPPPGPLETRLEIVTPRTDRPESFALSPDGRQIVFVASDEGASRLWLRPLATTVAQPLQGTEGARLPFWSPDGRSIGFFADAALKRFDLGGSAPQTLAVIAAGQGGTWNTDGVIVFSPSTTSALLRVSATGGAPVAVTQLGPRQQGHVLPYFLPDGRRFLFAVGGAPDTAGVYMGALDGSAPTRLTPGDSPRFLLSGWLLWVREGTLLAQRLDTSKAALIGEPVTLADGVGAVSIAAAGPLAYRKRGQPAATHLVRSVGHSARHSRRPGRQSSQPTRVTRWSPRGRVPHGAG